MSSNIKEIAAKIKEHVIAESLFTDYKFFFYSRKFQTGSQTKAEGNKITLSFVSDSFQGEFQANTIVSVANFDLETIFTATNQSSDNDISRLDDIENYINAIENAIAIKKNLNLFLDLAFVKGVTLRTEQVECQDINKIAIKTSVLVTYVKNLK